MALAERLASVPSLLRAVAVSVALTLTGCYQDMMKATPFGLSEARVAEGPQEERINVWPLLYHRAPATSVLWPLVEITDSTWSVRPIVARYGDNLDLLWPFVQLWEGGQKGMLFPLFFWGPEHLALSPLFLHTSSERATTFVTPLFGWGGHKDGSAGFLYLPVYAYARAGESGRAGIPPLLSWWSWRGDGGWGAHLFLSLWGMERHPGASSEHLFPFYGREREWDESRERRSLVVVPFYWDFGQRDEDTTTTTLVLFPFFAASEEREREGGKDRGLEGEPQERVASFQLYPLLLTGWGRSRSDAWRLLGPLYYGRERFESVSNEAGAPSDPLALSSRTRILPLLLSGWHDHGEDLRHRDWHFLLSLVAAGGSQDSSFSRVLPLYATWKERDRSAWMLLAPLIYWNRDPHEVGWSLFPLLFGSASKERIWGSLLLNLVEWERGPDKSGEHLFPLFGRERKRVTIQGEDGSRVTGDRSTFHILLFLYDRLEEPLLGGSGGSGRAQGDVPVDVATGLTYRRSRVLWRLWHDEEIGERRSLDVFPFIAYDREGDQDVTFSWLYKLFRYERRGSQKALYLFFLPAIHWGAGSQ